MCLDDCVGSMMERFWSGARRMGFILMGLSREASKGFASVWVDNVAIPRGG